MGGLRLQTILGEEGASHRERERVFALCTLGVVEAIAAGALSPMDAVRVFFNYDNCAFVRKNLPIQAADDLMAHGVQLPDLFDILPPEDANLEFLHEIERMRSLCRELLEGERAAA